MTDHEQDRPVRKLGAAGWTVLLFILAIAGSFFGAMIYLVIMYANTMGGGQ